MRRTILLLFIPLMATACSALPTTPPEPVSPAALPTAEGGGVTHATPTLPPTAVAPTSPPAPSPTRREELATLVAPAPPPPNYVRRTPFVLLDNPKFISASQAKYLNGTDRVLGVSINGDTRAYPVMMMSYHHIANDVVGGKPILVTF